MAAATPFPQASAAPAAQPADPVRNPDWYQQKALADLAARQPAAARAADRTPLPPTGLDRPGMQSVMAAGSPQLKGMAGGPPGLPADSGGNAFSTPPVRPVGPPPGPPDPFRNQTAGGPGYGAAQASMAPDEGIPSGMVNAFTPPGSRRPIPSDFGPPNFVENAFSSPPLPQEMAAMLPQKPGGFGNAFVPHNPFPTAPAQPSPAAYAMAGPYPGGYGPAGYPAVGYGQPRPATPMMAVPPSAPVMPRAQASAEPVQPDTGHLLALLKDSLFPSQREWAAECLSRRDWQAQPQVVRALLTAAREDPAATVRASCVRALAAMKVCAPSVLATVQALKSDPDARVRHEVEEALPALGAAGSVRPASGSSAGK
jgi:hypothetical protein